MVFSSLFFVFLFLPLQLLVYYLVPKRQKNTVLLIFSLIFYAWSGPVYLLILVGEAFVSYFLANKIQKSFYDAARFYFALECIILLAVLVFFKYLGLLAQTVNAILGLVGTASIPVPEITLPIGISFYTFQLISYVADVYDGRVKANRYFWKILLYASLFHQCIAGPIVRYETVCEEIDHREIDIDDVFYGILRFSTGLAKKAVLANSVAAVVDSLCGNGVETLKTQTVGGFWMIALFYTLQIYLDFSAYSDMAIGMGCMVGFHYLENFKYPYIAASVQDFWRRWHISLSTFFRDYVYIPLGGSRVNVPKHIFNLFVVWALTGLWHGASANFVLWGLYYFVFLVIEKYVFNNKKIKGIGNIYTIIVVMIGWVIFKFDSFEELKIALAGMFGFAGGGLWNLQCSSLLKNNIFLLIFSILACTPVFKLGYRRLCDSNSYAGEIACNIFEVAVPVIMIILSTLALVGNSYNPFLYFRF